MCEIAGGRGRASPRLRRLYPLAGELVCKTGACLVAACCLQNLATSGVPVKIILDSAVAFVMERVDIILVGAEGVVENGIINALGTYQVAIIAKAMSKPMYVAAECYKFVRFFPFNQQVVAYALSFFCRQSLDGIVP